MVAYSTFYLSNTTILADTPTVTRVAHRQFPRFMAHSNPLDGPLAFSQ